MASSRSLITIVVPVYNEAAGLERFHAALTEQLAELPDYVFEVIYCNDGSTDGTLKQLLQLAEANSNIRVLSLSRNFGKEAATTAGLRAAKGKAVITLDADGQHPIELLPTFLERWQAGVPVVIGLRTDNQSAGFMKRWGSKLFYGLFNRFTGMALVPNATDYRLIDARVNAEFCKLSERNRITRGLIDWLGYQRVYIRFRAKPRLHGDAPYSFRKLFKLAIDSAISLSSSPLYVTAYIGVIVLPLSLLLGLVMVVDALLGDPFNWHATGGAYVLVLILFLIGILLMSQGIIGLYLSHIHSETQNRPLYVIDEAASRQL